ncbi:MAG: protein phosphatase 2C domain-containing protein, partial [candidate division KSB1 bacterium]|nr:protein phosphatase 2C domain-containing protein [candidate division KSB1 bacterium]
MSEVLKITFANCSDLGLKRTENQDYFGKFPKTSDSLALPKGQLFVVADGMGGHLGGREASRLAVDTLGEVYYSEPAETIVSSLQRAMEEANQRIHAQSVGNPHFRGMGTTCTALVLKDDRAYIAHVGDSRAYR